MCVLQCHVYACVQLTEQQTFVGSARLTALRRCAKIAAPVCGATAGGCSSVRVVCGVSDALTELI